MRDEMDKSADAQLMSRAEWLRQAAREKLAREAAEISRWTQPR